ncbi:hypothetical protein C1M56_02370 [Vibrio diazotrophicus]|nr:hypothetical protein C1M56_02370 [Vibrio diazotrophicus]
MITARSFNINSTTLKFNNDEYPLVQIKRSRVKTNTLKDHAIRLIIFGLIASSVVWIVTPNYFGIYAGPFSIFAGMFLALLSVRKYELQVEFEHSDETGLQWISIAKTNKKSVKLIFDTQVEKIQHIIR